jgi:hypothetical protein
MTIKSKMRFSKILLLNNQRNKFLNYSQSKFTYNSNNNNFSSNSSIKNQKNKNLLQIPVLKCRIILLNHNAKLINQMKTELKKIKKMYPNIRIEKIIKICTQ